MTVGGGGREGQRIEQYAPKLSSVVSNGIVLQQIDFSEGIKPEADVTLVMSFERSLSGGQVNGSLQCGEVSQSTESPLSTEASGFTTTLAGAYGEATPNFGYFWCGCGSEQVPSHRAMNKSSSRHYVMSERCFKARNTYRG